MDVRREIRFLLNGAPVALGRVGPRDMALDWLRLERRLRGTKEGCAEGDCGACTVLVGRPKTQDGSGEGMVWEPVNACIRPLASLDGRAVVTVEALAEGGALHPVQRAMVEHHGSQCGFCTPGIVMALVALWLEGGTPSEAAIDRALQGNLCRCTGYAPIVRAMQAAAEVSREGDPLLARAAETAAALRAMADGARVEIGAGAEAVILPRDADDLAAVLVERPEATVVAGATDVGLWVTKMTRPVGPAVFVGHLEELRRIEATAAGLRIGAGATYAEARAPLVAHVPELAELWDRIGGPQVRAMGTIGGNIANGSPIGDTAPPFIALGARLALRRGAERREMALEDFFLDYGKQDRQPGEWVEAVTVPAPRGPFAVYKISKRRDEDITAVLGAFHLRMEGGKVAEARLAFGGMAGTPKRARAAEAALVGRAFDAAAAEAAAAALARDFTPLSDMRASAEYRMAVAGALLRRFAAEQAGEAARLPRDAA
jgi:xanthine dehydrogenase small subunit